MKINLTAHKLKLWAPLPLAALVACWLAGGAAHAAILTYDADPAVEKGKLVPGEQPPEPLGRIFPDLPMNFKERISVKNDGFSMIPGLVILGDYTQFDQDEANIRQLGIQESAWETRAMRLILRGHIGSEYKVGYLMGVEYNDLKFLDGQLWQVSDLAFDFPLTGTGRTKLVLGKMKEAFSYEMVGDAANLPHQERLLNPFFQSRNIGAQITHIAESQRYTLRAGVFNDSRFETGQFDAGDWQAAARLSGLILDDTERNRYLHFGVAGRYVGASGDELRYRGRAESNVSSNFVDTGTFSADHAYHLGLEALWNEGPFSLLAEFTQAWVTSSATGDPSFFGCYLTASWVLTGESRPYDRTVGYARRIMPKSKWGAPELVVRLAHVDLEDAEARGGEFDRLSIGLNWWATRRWKMGMTYGRTWLDRDGTNGVADSLLARVQWVF
jgi:phosphate-selective porin OprO and OprP